MAKSNQFSPEVRERAVRMVREHEREHAVRDLGELAVPPGNRLERLVGDRRGQYSIRVNQRYRICFRWEEGYADEVEVTDYH